MCGQLVTQQNCDPQDDCAACTTRSHHRALQLFIAAYISAGEFLTVPAGKLCCEQFAARGATATVNYAVIATKKIAIKQYRLTTDLGEFNVARRRFRREAEILRSMDHPNIVGFLGILDDPNRLCIVAPWMAGGELNGFLKRNLGVPRAPLAYQIAAGLDYLHSQDIIHGDLKGANILIDEHGNAHISDFGSSYAVPRHDKTGSSQELPQDILQNPSTGGSCRWMAPELLLPPQLGSRATFQSDVFAFGMVMYEILAGGDIPFLKKSEIEAVLAILSGHRPAKPQNTPDEVWTLASKCWEQEAAERLSIDSILTSMSTYRSLF